ncbi:DUF554 family protein [Brachyspira sp.]|uniref:DUF554 family protein n=1 Tax=Brachyspira sp. TaxID=1977261 RepID=UPI00261CCC90|nr:DUF554 family protein [Brachyspira sp.]
MRALSILNYVNEVSAVRGATVMMIGINLLKIAKIKMGDFLPAIIYSILLFLLIPYI